MRLIVSFAYNAALLFAVSREKRPDRTTRRRRGGASGLTGGFLSSSSSSSSSSSADTQQEEESASIPAAGATTPDKYSVLLEWMRSNGAATVNDKVEVRPSARGGGYGAFVAAPAEQGELLFSIPREGCCVTVRDALGDPACGEAFAKLIEQAGPGGTTVAMAGFLAKEWLVALEDAGRGTDLLNSPSSSSSNFGPYLATLPWDRGGSNNQEHMLYWSDDEVETYLRGSMGYGEAKDLRKEVALATRVISSIIGKTIREYRAGEEDNDSGFKWPWESNEAPAQSAAIVEGLPEAVTGAFVSLLTRSFQEEDGGEDDNDNGAEKLVPLLDMLQHSDEPNISHATRADTGAVEVRARRPIASGEELLNRYHSELEESMPHHRFFTRYGFVPGVREPIRDLLEAKATIFFAQKAEV